MSILKVSQMGHPVLRRVADPIPSEHIPGDRLRQLVSDMHETMIEYQGVGLAGPQVHVSNRILVYRYADEDEEAGVVTLINPVIKPVSEETVPGWEGCLSIPGIRGLVPRYARIEVSALTEEGEALEYEAEDFEARVIQHEVDHLDGILYLDRMTDLRSLSFEREFEVFHAGDAGEAEDGPE